MNDYEGATTFGAWVVIEVILIIIFGFLYAGFLIGRWTAGMDIKMVYSCGTGSSGFYDQSGYKDEAFTNDKPLGYVE